jgi:hypothetical protein
LPQNSEAAHQIAFPILVAALDHCSGRVGGIIGTGYQEVAKLKGDKE